MGIVFLLRQLYPLDSTRGDIGELLGSYDGLQIANMERKAKSPYFQGTIQFEAALAGKAGNNIQIIFTTGQVSSIPLVREDIKNKIVTIQIQDGAMTGNEIRDKINNLSSLPESMFLANAGTDYPFSINLIGGKNQFFDKSRKLGMLGDIKKMFEGPLSAILKSKGINSCLDIPRAGPSLSLKKSLPRNRRTGS